MQTLQCPICENGDIHSLMEKPGMMKCSTCGYEAHNSVFVWRFTYKGKTGIWMDGGWYAPDNETRSWHFVASAQSTEAEAQAAAKGRLLGQVVLFDEIPR